MGDKWMDRLDLPEESMPRETLVEVTGHRRVLIEHHRGVTEYGCQMIRVKVKFGYIQVWGEGLQITRMTRDQLIISGRISGIRFERTCKQ